MFRDSIHTDFENEDFAYGDFPDFDFSDFSGRNLKTSLTKLKKTPVSKKQALRAPQKPVGRQQSVSPRSATTRRMPAQSRVAQRPAPVRKPLSKSFGATDKRPTTITGTSPKKIAKVLVPRDKEVIIKGVSQFMMKQNDPIKDIGYYKGKKLKELVFIMNNNSAVPFEVELFNPSMPLDYLYSTTQNLNDKITVAGGVVSYSDVVFNILANPTMIPNAKFLFAGTNAQLQKNQPLLFTNKEITGTRSVEPLNLDLKIDNLQVANDIVFFDITETLKAPYFPDGMDIIKYTVLPFTSVTMAFFFEQRLLKHEFYPESKSKNNKML